MLKSFVFSSMKKIWSDYSEILRLLEVRSRPHECPDCHQAALVAARQDVCLAALYIQLLRVCSFVQPDVHPAGEQAVEPTVPYFASRYGFSKAGSRIPLQDPSSAVLITKYSRI